MTSLDTIKHMIGDLARPWALWSVGGATAHAIFVGRDPEVIGAAGLILVAIYGAKAWENNTSTKAAASVETAKVTARPAADDGELPPDQRIAP